MNAVFFRKPTKLRERNPLVRVGSVRDFASFLHDCCASLDSSVDFSHDVAAKIERMARVAGVRSSANIPLSANVLVKGFLAEVVTVAMNELHGLIC